MSLTSQIPYFDRYLMDNVEVVSVGGYDCELLWFHHQHLDMKLQRERQPIFDDSFLLRLWETLLLLFVAACSVYLSLLGQYFWWKVALKQGREKDLWGCVDLTTSNVNFMCKYFSCANFPIFSCLCTTSIWKSPLPMHRWNSSCLRSVVICFIWVYYILDP